jgi:hypothetical protein
MTEGQMHEWVKKKQATIPLFDSKGNKLNYGIRWKVVNSFKPKKSNYIINQGELQLIQIGLDETYKEVRTVEKIVYKEKTIKNKENKTKEIREEATFDDDVEEL